MADKTKREQWIKKGWKRGAFIDLNVHPELIDLLPEKLKFKIGEQKQAYLFPILYDCSLINESFEQEPWVQVLICWPSDKPDGDGNFKFGKNSRKIDFPVLIEGNKTYLRSEAIGFSQFDREKLLEITPSTLISWPEKGLEQILNWVSERYKQPTFPDEWNERLAKKKKQLEKLWKKSGFVNNCSGLYLNITPFAEVATTEAYTLKAFLVISSTLTSKEHRVFVRDHEQDLLQTLSSIIKSIPNIEILAINTIKEDQFTKAEERYYQRWQLERLSYKDLDNAPLPAELEI